MSKIEQIIFGLLVHLITFIFIRRTFYFFAGTIPPGFAKTGFSLSSASQAVEALENKDYLIQNKNEYKLVDPLIKYIFSKNN